MRGKNFSRMSDEVKQRKESNEGMDQTSGCPASAACRLTGTTQRTVKIPTAKTNGNRISAHVDVTTKIG